MGAMLLIALVMFVAFPEALSVPSVVGVVLGLVWSAVLMWRLLGRMRW